jgi:hypothetical protein
VAGQQLQEAQQAYSSSSSSNSRTYQRNAHCYKLCGWQSWHSLIRRQLAKSCATRAATAAATW